MPRDALDPGPDGTYPNWPRLADGTPNPERMPTGRTTQDGVLIDVTPRDPMGVPIVPPTITNEGDEGDG